MSVLISIFVVLLGLAIGSFLNVCISRLPWHESIVAPRSRCPHCMTPILSRDNIPLLSWVLLKGRCRNCGKRISVRYPLIEAVTAVLFLLCYLEFGLTPHGIVSAILCCFLLGLAVMDAETLRLPDTLTLSGLVLGVISSGIRVVGGAVIPLWHQAGFSLLWAALAAILILLIRALYWLVRHREGIGLGDAKLMAMIAAWLGPWQAGLVLFLAVIGAAAYGLGLIIWGGVPGSSEKNGFTARIPLGAFLCAAGILALFEGDPILSWYLHFFQ